jgi:hypothetical protein
MTGRLIGTFCIRINQKRNRQVFEVLPITVDQVGSEHRTSRIRSEHGVYQYINVERRNVVNFFCIQFGKVSYHFYCLSEELYAQMIAGHWHLVRCNLCLAL